MSGFDDYRDLCEERDQLRAELEASRRELFAYQADVEGANRRELSFATACVRNVEGITVGGALEMQRDEIASLRAELAELRARVPAICFPRQPNGEDGWVIDANYVAAIHKDCFPIEWQPCEEEVEAVLLAVERAAPVTPAAVPEDVAKDALERIAAIVHNGGLARISEWDAICAVRRLSLPWWNSDGTLNELRDRADAAILAAKKEKGNDPA